MITPREKALEILGFSAGSEPSREEILKAKVKLIKELENNKENIIVIDEEESRENFRLDIAHCILVLQLPGKVITLCDEELDKVDYSKEKLLKLLDRAILCANVDFLEKLLSRFKSGKDGKFGDYVNNKDEHNFTPLYHACKGSCPQVVELLLKHKADPNLLPFQASFYVHSTETKEEYINTYYNILFYSTLDSIDKEDEIKFKEQFSDILGDDWVTKKDYIKITKLLIKYGANPNKVVKMFYCFTDDPVKELLFPWSGNNKMKKIKQLVIQYGVVDKECIAHNTALAVLCCLLIVGLADLGASSSPLWVIPAVVLAPPTLVFAYNALYALIKPTLFPTKPSPEFIEVENKKATDLDGDVSPKAVDQAIGAV